MRKEHLTITFESDEAKEDFIDWLSDSGQGVLNDYLQDRRLDTLELNFIDEDNIEAIG